MRKKLTRRKRTRRGGHTSVENNRNTQMHPNNAKVISASSQEIEGATGSVDDQRAPQHDTTTESGDNQRLIRAHQANQDQPVSSSSPVDPQQIAHPESPATVYDPTIHSDYKRLLESYGETTTDFDAKVIEAKNRIERIRANPGSSALSQDDQTSGQVTQSNPGSSGALSQDEVTPSNTINDKQSDQATETRQLPSDYEEKKNKIEREIDRLEERGEYVSANTVTLFCADHDIDIKYFRELLKTKKFELKLNEQETENLYNSICTDSVKEKRQKTVAGTRCKFVENGKNVKYAIDKKGQYIIDKHTGTANLPNCEGGVPSLPEQLQQLAPPCYIEKYSEKEQKPYYKVLGEKSVWKKPKDMNECLPTLGGRKSRRTIRPGPRGPRKSRPRSSRYSRRR